ncbi:hypothetical protein KS4_11380 [Poriferisphaera corsica]|uniref:DUF5658 domain-containing protein n=2 Tax=Poriferisphaera corsica TaxID=2528020 RepID=A0A517YSA9_9BACT|nr:hypothetical protein KS4_11380 [Poriferisphaera corsica]
MQDMEVETKATNVLNRVAKKMGQPEVAYPGYYKWLIFVSAMDAIMTWAILMVGGIEANPIAAAVMSVWGYAGMVIFKFLLVAFFVVMCEWISRKQYETGRVLVSCGVIISAFPSLLAAGLLVGSLMMG